MAVSSRYNILVPTDLSEVANYSIDHATEIVRIFHHKIVLLHVVGKNVLGTPKEKEIADKLKEHVKHIQERAPLEVRYLIEEGSIFTTISEVADRIQAEFIILGIHGRKGVQHLMGSYAYKVVCSANVPVMVVKNTPHHVGYKNIVLPIDFMQESTQKILKAVKFANYFGAKIRIFGFLGTRNKAIIFQKEALLKKVKDTFADLGVDVTTDLCVDPNRDWAEALMTFADQLDADLILIVAEKGSEIPDIFLANSTEKIIDKADVPVLTVVPSPEENDQENETVLALRSFIDPMGVTGKKQI